jgi:hypothetical protein
MVGSTLRRGALSLLSEIGAPTAMRADGALVCSSTGFTVSIVCGSSW